MTQDLNPGHAEDTLPEHDVVGIQQLDRMGRALLAVERLAPTHPHPGTAGSPAAQWAIGPFASLLDRARDAVRTATS